MTRRERLERKLEKRQEWAAGRDRKASAEFDRADLREEKSGIPFGQPILVGHHSERRHRKVLERADSAMRRGCESADMAKHHRSKAAGLEAQLDSTIYSDDADALERLREKIDGLEAKRARIKAANKIVRRKPRAEQTPEKVAELTELLGSEAAAVALFVPDCGGVGYPSYVGSNLSGNIKRCKDRLKQIRYQQAKQERAEQAGGFTIDRSEEHNRCTVTFAEKPEREVLRALRDAGYAWGRGSWNGYLDKLPQVVRDMEAES